MAKYDNSSRSNRKSLITIVILVLILASLIAVAIKISQEPVETQPTEPSESIDGTTEPSSQPTEPSSEPTEPSSEPTEPTPPPVVKESTATISATGDMLMHMPIINYYKNGSSYNFDGIFTRFREYVLAADFAVTNLETTLCGSDNGYNYNGYPAFNCPDAIADSLKYAGFDMILTANNHSYDTKIVGMRRTVDVLLGRDLSVLGTGKQADFPKFEVRNINGISVGMACYTYNIGVKSDGSIYLNNSNVSLTPEATALINTFSYDYLDLFYREIESVLAQMKAQGAEATVMFIHWGDEYKLTPNTKQTAIAQKLCDLGVDVIIGGHPHVVQPVELLTSAVDPDHKTVCLYSMGNAVSNQRLGNLSNVKTAHTEDGVLFSVTFAKYSDGTVILESAELLPLWVNSSYEILPLDQSVADWKAEFGVSDSVLAQMKASLERTNAIVSEGMAAVGNYLKELVAETEAKLNVAK